MRPHVALLAALSLVGCVVSLRDPASSANPPPAESAAPPAAAPGGPATEPVLGPVGTAPAPGSPAGGAAGPATSPATAGPGAGTTTTPPHLAEPETLEEKHISRSVGEPGALIVFWPRIIPREIVDQNRELAAALQRHVRTVIQRNLTGQVLDVRPEPERVCPQGGCKVPTVGLLISRESKGCLVLALVSRPGESPTKIIPWAGDVKLRADTVPFREYPEGQITIADYVPCNALLSTMDDNQEAVLRAIREAMAQPAGGS